MKDEVVIKMPVRQIIGAIDAAAARWQNRQFASRLRTRDAVAARTGYSLASVEYAFDRLFELLAANAIAAVIVDELGSLEVLDDFAERVGRPRTRALPLGRLCIIASRTTIGVALIPAAFALAAKCTVLVKDREDELTSAFFNTLCEELPELRHAATARPWRGDEDGVDLADFDCVVAFGAYATLQRIAERLTLRTKFIPFGTKASAGYITREALTDEAAAAAVAQRAARDIVLYEGEGCLSLHALFVENGAAVSLQRFCELLGDAVRLAAAEFPPPRDAATSARYAIAKELAAFRGGSEGIHVGSPFEEPPLFFPRALGIRGVEGPTEAARYFERHGIELEALAVAGRREDLLALAIERKAAQMVQFGTMQAPPLGAFHGGRPRIAEFVRWIVDET